MYSATSLRAIKKRNVSRLAIKKKLAYRHLILTKFTKTKTSPVNILRGIVRSI